MSPVLVLIDVQRNMLQPPEPVPASAEVGAAIDELLLRARDAGATVVHVRNNGGTDDPDAPGTPGWELVHEPRSGEPVIDKSEQDAFVGTNLLDLLPAGAPLVLAGMQSEFCVRATALSAQDKGFPVFVVRGAHATYDGSTTAADVSHQVEKELDEAGVSIVESVSFD
jgi:nicotinamidase-related amidase